MGLKAPTKTIRMNARYRRAILERCKTDLALRERIKAKCRKSIVYWVNTFVWQFNPRKKKRRELKVGPFLLWPFQKKALKLMLWCIRNDEDLVIEKSREMGASWLILIAFLYLFLFDDGQTFKLISRNEKLVDSDDPDSLFWKLDFMLARIPDWMKPPGLVRKSMLFSSTSRNNTIAGEASTGRFGVGGRATALGIDEFSQIKEAAEVRHRTSDTSGCRIFNFTHKGINTEAYRLTQTPEFKKLRMHWSEHPDKNQGLYRYDPAQGKPVILTPFPFPPDYPFVVDGSPLGGPFPGLRSPWYDRECRRKGDSRAVAMDLDINPEGTMSQFFDPVQIEGLRQTCCCPPAWQGDVSFDPQDQTVKPELVVEPGGRLKLWLKPTPAGKVRPGDFVVAADVATGTGATPSCVCVADRRTGEKVGQYTNPFIDPRDFGALLVALARLFCDETGQPAMLIWETPGPGLSAGKKILDMGFRRIYWKRSEHTLGKKQSDHPGWHSSAENQDVLLRDYRNALYDGRFVNHDEDSLKETLKFAYAGPHVRHAGEASPNDPSGASQNHGDHVIADALASKLCQGKSRHEREEDKEEVPPWHPSTLAGRRLLAQNQRHGRLY